MMMASLKTGPGHILKPAARFLFRLSLAASHLLIVTLAAWAVLRLYPGDRWLPVRLGSYAAPWLLLALIPALLIELIGRRRWLTLLAGLLLLILAGQHTYLFTAPIREVQADALPNQLRVMSFNAHHRNQKAEAIARLIQTEAPDIIAMQELMPALALQLRPRLEADYPYQLYDNDHGFPGAILSRYPLMPHLVAPEELWRTQHATVETPWGPVAVWNVHPSTAVSQEGWEAQRRTLSAIGQEISQLELPLILLGDLNTTARAENYQLVSRGLINVHHAAGQGFGFTFPETNFIQTEYSLPWYFIPLYLGQPLVRIDHILVSQDFIPQSSRVIPAGYGSDHRPVIATIQPAW